MSQKEKLRRKKQWGRCVTYFRNRCAYCGCGGNSFTRDHFIPKDAGGTNELSNLVPSCEKCNNTKGNDLPKKWCTPDQLKRVRQYQSDLVDANNDVSSKNLKGKLAMFSEFCIETKKLRGLIKQAKKVMVACNVSDTETHYFKTTKKEALEFINNNEWWIEVSGIFFTYQRKVLCIG